MENIGTPIKGIYHDTLINAHGRIVHDGGWVSNTIVTQCRILMARFMTGEPSQEPEAQGIQYLAVGQGDETWDTKGTPTPTPDVTTLQGEYPQHISADQLQLVYLNDKDVEVPFPTNRLQITATLEAGYPPPLQTPGTYPLRTFGLFGKFSGNPYMVNCVHHPVIHKDNASTLKRVIRLYF